MPGGATDSGCFRVGERSGRFVDRCGQRRNGSPALRRGKHVDRDSARRIGTILRAVATELEV